MKLYITPTSPYARVARIVALEKGLADRIEVITARTRTADSPYYAVNPSGRVPFLVRDDGGPALEDSQLIAAYLDNLGTGPSLILPYDMEAWEYGRLETYARSMTDGLSVWVREMRRPQNERSPTIIAHEQARAERLADYWEQTISHPLMAGPLNLAQIYLLAGLDQARFWGLVDLAATRPRLGAWLRQLHERPSVRETAPGH